MKMKALYFSELHKVELSEVDKPDIINDTDIIVKVTLTTICGTDLHIIHGLIPQGTGFVLGHEYVGVVEKVGKAIKNFKEGDRVIGPPAPFCGVCENCLKGNFSHCLHGSIGRMHGSKFLGGTHAEYIRVPFGDACLCHVPDTLKDEQVIFIFDILSTAYSAIERANLKPNDNVVIFGAGPVGLCGVIGAKLYSPRKIILVGRQDQFRLDIGKKLGATDIIKSVDGNIVEKIFELTNGNGANIAIEASGATVAIQQAVECVGVKGRVSLVGLGGDATVSLSQVFFKNININMGLGSFRHVRTLMSLIESGQIDLSSLITHRMPLDKIEEAIKLFEDRNSNAIKILIKP